MPRIYIVGVVHLMFVIIHKEKNTFLSLNIKEIIIINKNNK